MWGRGRRREAESKGDDCRNEGGRRHRDRDDRCSTEGRSEERQEGQERSGESKSRGGRDGSGRKWNVFRCQKGGTRSCYSSTSASTSGASACALSGLKGEKHS